MNTHKQVLMSVIAVVITVVAGLFSGCQKDRRGESDDAIPVTGVMLDKETLTLKVGETEILTATVLPDNATNKTVMWTSSDNNVATVNNGEITAKTEGMTTITVTTQNHNETAICIVTVSNDVISVAGVTVCPTAVMLEAGRSTTLSATVTPSNADDLSVTWASDKGNIATVEDGVVTVHAIGEAVITCTTTDGAFTAETNVIVNPARNDNDYATLVLGFYFGDMTMTSPMNMPVEANNPITVKYQKLNTIKLSVDEAFMGGTVLMKVDCEAELTQTEDGFYAVCETTADVIGTICPVTVESIFDGIGTVNMTIYVSEVPIMGNLVLVFTGVGTTAIDPCFLPD